MSPSALKKRKLNHNPKDSMDADDSPASNSESDAQFSAESEDDAPTSQPQKIPLQHKRAHEDDTMIYAGGDYKSSLFKLQVDELLTEVQPNYEKRLRGVDEALHTLKGLIESFENRDALSVAEATKSFHKSHKTAIPFPDPKPDINAPYKLVYAKPSNINVVGSYVLKTMVKSEGVLSIDMVVIMPSSIFQDKDYLNYRYFYKRAYYLACLAAGLQTSVSGQFTLKYEYLHGNTLLPILSLRSITPETKGKTSTEFEVRLIPAVQSKCFPGSKLHPEKNCIRAKDKLESDPVTASPTPFYNASLRSNCNYENYLKLLYSSGKQSSSFKDACILGRIWLRQRGFGSSLSCGGFGHFEWTALTALLMKGGASKGHSVLSPGYSSYQMFKAVLQFLALSNLVDKPLILGSTNIVVAKSNTPMLYDCERDQNVLYKMTPWSWSMLQEEAKISLSMLNNSILDPFESLFIARSNQPLQRFDCLFQVAECPDTIKTATLDYSPRTRSFSNRLYQVLRDGLTDRVKLINIEEPGILPWSVKSAGPSETNTRLLISIVFDPANIDRLVDHGPPAEEKKKAAKFQKFWGDKAELRRFKDGSILESLIWSTGSSYDVVNEILSHLLKRHFAIESGIDTLIGEAYGKLLPGSGTGTKGFEGLNEEFKTLETAIRNLDGLPLQLRQFSAISPQLRYSSMDIPSFSPRRPLKEPADVLLQFEGSGRWPDDVVAIQRTKIAFLLKVGNLLQEVNETITTRVGLENEDHPLQNCAFLDIVFESGAALRLRIHNDREQTLLERQVKDKSIDQHSREEAVSALSVFKRTFLQLPLLTQSIATHCTRFPLLSPTIRLVKMWFDRHMLIPHVNEELIELLVSHTFLHPHPWTAPSSVMTGFLRTIHFISKWDWRTSPLIVDFTGTMTSKEVEAVTTRLEAWRKIDPGMVRTVLFAASNHDLTGTVFTSNGPSKLVAARMTALARSATKLVKEKALDLDHRTLFAASTTDYDFVVHLSSKFTENSMRKGSGQSKFKNLEVQSESKLDLIGYQPVRKYVQELEEIYSNSVIFFHSTMAGSVIGGLWNPHAAAARPFKVNSAYATKIVETMDKDVEAAGEVIIDKSAILAEIARLGGDMVSRVEANR